MDILNPQLLWIGKRCYRVNPSNDSSMEPQQQQPTNEYIENDLYSEEEEVEAQDEFEVIEVTPNRYKTTFHAPQAFFGAIIGAKGSVKKRIEGETRTDIVIPKHGSGSDDIKITGTKRESVCLARRRIELIVINCRRKQRPTHFTCVRLVEPTIKDNFNKFKDGILKNGSNFGLQEEMFTSPNKLHVTIGMMCLMDDVDRSIAVKLLNECCESIVIPAKREHKQITVTVRGVEIMNDDPSSARVLFGKIESVALQQIADAIYNRFIHAGLAKREFNRDWVKLHMTLMKANRENDDEDDDTNKRKFKSKSFDVRRVLEEFADYEFGSQDINDIQLAIIQTNDVDGFYKCTTSIRF